MQYHSDLKRKVKSKFLTESKSQQFVCKRQEDEFRKMINDSLEQ